MLLFLAKGHAKYMVLISEVSSQEPWLEATGSFSGVWSAWVALLSKSLPILTGSPKEEPMAAVPPLVGYLLVNCTASTGERLLLWAGACERLSSGLAYMQCSLTFRHTRLLMNHRHFFEMVPTLLIIRPRLKKTITG